MTVEIPEDYNPLTFDWAEEIGRADEVVGRELISGEAADKLIGVPFMVTKVVYRDGIQRPKVPYKSDYVSCEAIVAPLAVLQKRVNMGRLDLSKISVEPGEQIVFNDGSTGIYRQVTEYLHVKGFIRLPEPLIRTGPMGDTSFDLPRSQWESGGPEATAGISVRLFCPRGLRYSEYETDYSPDGAKTRYIG